MRGSSAASGKGKCCKENIAVFMSRSGSCVHRLSAEEEDCACTLKGYRHAVCIRRGDRERARSGQRENKERMAKSF